MRRAPKIFLIVWVSRVSNMRRETSCIEKQVFVAAIKTSAFCNWVPGLEILSYS